MQIIEKIGYSDLESFRLLAAANQVEINEGQLIEYTTTNQVYVIKDCEHAVVGAVVITANQQLIFGDVDLELWNQRFGSDEHRL